MHPVDGERRGIGGSSPAHGRRGRCLCCHRWTLHGHQSNPLSLHRVYLARTIEMEQHRVERVGIEFSLRAAFDSCSRAFPFPQPRTTRQHATNSDVYVGAPAIHRCEPRSMSTYTVLPTKRVRHCRAQGSAMHVTCTCMPEAQVAHRAAQRGCTQPRVNVLLVFASSVLLHLGQQLAHALCWQHVPKPNGVFLMIPEEHQRKRSARDICIETEQRGGVAGVGKGMRRRVTRKTGESIRVRSDQSAHQRIKHCHIPNIPIAVIVSLPLAIRAARPMPALFCTSHWEAMRNCNGEGLACRGKFHVTQSQALWSGDGHAMTVHLCDKDNHPNHPATNCECVVLLLCVQSDCQTAARC